MVNSKFQEKKLSVSESFKYHDIHTVKEGTIVVGNKKNRLARLFALYNLNDGVLINKNELYSYKDVDKYNKLDIYIFSYKSDVDKIADLLNSLAASIIHIRYEDYKFIGLDTHHLVLRQLIIYKQPTKKQIEGAISKKPITKRYT